MVSWDREGYIGGEQTEGTWKDRIFTHIELKSKNIIAFRKAWVLKQDSFKRYTNMW